jgi:hypothetical protein
LFGENYNINENRKISAAFTVGEDIKRYPFNVNSHADAVKMQEYPLMDYCVKIFIY